MTFEDNKVLRKRVKRSLKKKKLVDIDYGPDLFDKHTDTVTHKDNIRYHLHDINKHLVDRHDWYKFYLSLPETWMLVIPKSLPPQKEPYESVQKLPEPPLIDLISGIDHNVLIRMKEVKINKIEELDIDYFEPGILDMLTELNLQKRVLPKRYGLYFQHNRSQQVEVDEGATLSLKLNSDAFDCLFRTVHNIREFLNNTLGLNIHGRSRLANYYYLDKRLLDGDGFVRIPMLGQPKIMKIDCSNDFVFNVNGKPNVILVSQCVGLSELIETSLFSEEPKVIPGTKTHIFTTKFEQMLKQALVYLIFAGTTKAIITDYITTIYLEVFLHPKGEDDSDHGYLDVKFKTVNNRSTHGLTMRSLFAWFLYTGARNSNEILEKDFQKIVQITNRFVRSEIQYKAALDIVKRNIRPKDHRLYQIPYGARLEPVHFGAEYTFLKFPKYDFERHFDCTSDSDFVFIKIFKPLFDQKYQRKYNWDILKNSLKQIRGNYEKEVQCLEKIEEYKLLVSPENELSGYVDINSPKYFISGYIEIQDSQGLIEYCGYFIATAFLNNTRKLTTKEDYEGAIEQITLLERKIAISFNYIYMGDRLDYFLVDQSTGKVFFVDFSAVSYIGEPLRRIDSQSTMLLSLKDKLEKIRASSGQQ